MASPDERRPPQYPIEAVDRTLRALTLLGERPEVRLSEVRAHLDVGQSTAHRLMAMLVFHGFAVQDPASRTYRAGSALADLGIRALRADLWPVARPTLVALAASSGETVHLGRLEGTTLRYLDAVESEAMLRIGSRAGRTNPAHATSLGKAMLAERSDAEILALYPDRELERVTDRTTADRDALLAELAAIRARGWARNDQGAERGVCSVGMAVVHPVRGLLGALSIATPSARSDAGTEEKHAALLGDAVRAVLAALP
ncbi:DNA-binding transcriptional regulator KdgR [Actinomycetospora sp. NBRC 106375]|uniref:IclR family transcriptional regulator n=1 Tax=Actinomycetospora sp. NBRC 106375 TaxID=3032207 RepID=UPI0024A3227D|nr:IclR family transcriptional regulator [Actinomycetospora sp. NBRC 106375]GLZ49039.1 DNA-binding transcriptional regulator KdgR [Actinomycetospora sp. NBRC 106375]